MRHAELLGQRLAPGIDVHADDLVGPRDSRALDHVEADAAEAEHHDVGAGLDPGRVDHGADAGRDAATDVADLVERRVLADFRERDLRQHGVVRERRAAHVVVDLLAADREPAGAVRHHALALGGADRRAQVGLVRQARFALPAFRRVERDHVVALAQRRHARAHVDDHAGALVPEDHREESLRVGARPRELVRVAHAAGPDLDQHLAGSADRRDPRFRRRAAGLRDKRRRRVFSWGASKLGDAWAQD